MPTTNKSLQIVYLGLAIVGAVLPYTFFIRHFVDVGFGLGDFVAALFTTPAAGGFTVDLLISSLVFWIAIYHRHREGNGPKPLLFVGLNLTIGLSCALPAYLYANERGKAVGVVS